MNGEERNDTHLETENYQMEESSFTANQTLSFVHYADLISMSEYNQQATTYTQSAVSDLIHSPEYRRKMERCTMCSSCWYEGDYGSPNCVECGGYALERPCPICNGRCGRLWKRDIELVWKSICNFLEHSRSEAYAHWEGECGLPWEQQQGFLYNVLSDEMTSETVTDYLEQLSTQ